MHYLLEADGSEHARCTTCLRPLVASMQAALPAEAAGIEHASRTTCLRVLVASMQAALPASFLMTLLVVLLMSASSWMAKAGQLMVGSSDASVF